MIATTEPQMGRFSIDVELANHQDVIHAKVGTIAAEQVRRITVRGVVDTGATRLVIPERVANQLGLEISGTTKVRYADERTVERPLAIDVDLRYGGRKSVFTAIVEPDRQSALIGAIVLEELDFVVDCTAGRLVPRDPKQIVSEAE